MQNISPELLYWGVAGLIPLLALLLAWAPLKQLYRQHSERRRLDALGEGQLRNVLLDDGVDGSAFFERLVLSGEGIQLYLSVHREGSIFAGERLEQWVAVEGNTSRRFTNPLYRLRELLGVLRYHLPKTPVQGHLLFLGAASFPKGRPSEVLRFDELPEAGTEAVAIAEPYTRAWEALAERSSPASAELLAEISPPARPGRPRLLAAVILLLLEGGWLMLAR